ncbi:MAG: hypothetical protein IJA53_01330 [Spirochaetaceae bacterium]|nr:hypothetical protein [Spirochaetaceae bacterium]
MKRTNRLFLILIALLVLTGCEFLQSSLSSEIEKSVLEDSGIATISSANWYYNGTKDTNMKELTSLGSENYVASSVLVSFGKQVALKSENPVGSIELTYTGEDGLSTKKTFQQLSGSFTQDYRGYKINMADVLAYFDTTTIPSGTASMTIKVGGFVCAEGSQSGRAIPAIEHKMTIMPLFKSYDVDFSTCWYKEGDYVSIPLNGKVTVSLNNVKSSNGDEFSITTKENEILLTPTTNIFGKESTTTISLLDIMAENAGDSYSTTLNLNFVKNAIVMDGKEDINYSNERAVSVTDDSSDQSAFAGLGYDVSSNADITKLSIVNDDKNLYIGVAGNLSFTWNDGLVIMIAEEGGTEISRSEYQAATTESFKRGSNKPFAYLFHKPGAGGDSVSGEFGVYSNSTGTKTNITANSVANPTGWTTSSTGTFLEYSIPLADLGLTKDDPISVIAISSLHWDDGNAVCDVAPNAGVSKSLDDNNMSVQYDFSNGLMYTVK